MSRPRPIRRLLRPQLATLALVPLLASCEETPTRLDGPPDATTLQAPRAAQAQGNGPVLATIRAATAHYRSQAAAIDDGFFAASPCVAAPGVGGMGYHFLDPSRLMDGAVDPADPEILLYEPQPNGKARLVGVEFLVVAEVWDAGNEAPPSLMGVTFDEHRGAATHGLPFDHYELHVWSWRHNPAGLTTPFNPKVSCGAT